MIFVDFTGVKVKDIEMLRKKLKAGDSELKAAKKTLIRVALKDSKISLPQDIKSLPGEIALAFGYNDETAAAKTVYRASKENPAFKILGGFVDNKFFEAVEMIELAQLPSKEELLARLLGSISAPVSNFVYVLQANIKGLLYILANAKT